MKIIKSSIVNSHGEIYRRDYIKNDEGEAIIWFSSHIEVPPANSRELESSYQQLKEKTTKKEYKMYAYLTKAENGDKCLIVENIDIFNSLKIAKGDDTFIADINITDHKAFVNLAGIPFDVEVGESVQLIIHTSIGDSDKSVVVASEIQRVNERDVMPDKYDIKKRPENPLHELFRELWDKKNTLREVWDATPKRVLLPSTEKLLDEVISDLAFQIEKVSDRLKQNLMTFLSENDSE